MPIKSTCTSSLLQCYQICKLKQWVQKLLFLHWVHFGDVFWTSLLTPNVSLCTWIKGPLVSSHPNAPRSSGILPLTSTAGTGFDLAPLFSGHTHIYNKDMYISFQHHLWHLSFWETTVHQRSRMFVCMLWFDFPDSPKNCQNLWLRAKTKTYNTLVNCRDRLCARITMLKFGTSLFTIFF